MNQGISEFIMIYITVEGLVETSEGYRKTMGEYIKYDGEDRWALQIQKYLNDKLNYVMTVFPKIKQHIEGNEIFINESFTDSETLGFFRRLDKTITIISGNTTSRLQALHTLFHEIGHSVQDKRKGLDLNYDSIRKNSAYWREEIKAESYALQIFMRFLDVGNVIECAKESIRYFYEGLKEAKKKSHYFTVGYSRPTATTISGGWYITGSTNSTTTWAGTFISSNSTTSINQWSYTISYAC